MEEGNCHSCGEMYRSLCDVSKSVVWDEKWRSIQENGGGALGRVVAPCPPKVTRPPGRVVWAQRPPRGADCFAGKTTISGCCGAV